MAINVVDFFQKLFPPTIANPTSAFFNAGASFVPSPVTATTSLQLGHSKLDKQPINQVNIYFDVTEKMENINYILYL